MSSLPSTPKPRKRLRQFLTQPFTRSRSQSPSQSESPSRSSQPLPHVDPGASSSAIQSSEGTGQTTSSSVVGAPADNTKAGTRVVEPVGIISPTLTGPGPEVPIIVEPAHDESITMQPPIDVKREPLDDAADTALSLNPVDPSSNPVGTVASSEVPLPPLEHRSPNRSASERETSTTGTAATQGWKNQDPSWARLRRSLQILKNTSRVAVRNREGYENLAIELVELSELLNKHMHEPSSVIMSTSTTSVAMAIQRQVAEIQDRLDRVSTRGGAIREAAVDEEALVRHYRQIEANFRLLQINANMSTWRIVDEHLVNTRLESLSPAKEAAYDSSLATTIGRGGCTEGTRTEVLDGLESWLYDSTSSSIYWMNGMAGTGKTTIAWTLCERVEKRKLLAASFFCTRSSADCRNVTRIIPTIAYQIARYSFPFRSEICQILGQNPDIGSKNVRKQFEQLLMEPLKQVKDAIPDHILVVIDALDECEDRAMVENILDMLLRYAPEAPLKFLITSRPEPGIYDKLNHSSSRQVINLHDIEKSLVRADIELYLNEELAFMSPSPTDIEQLVERSGALFIYATTLVRYIRFGKRLADPHKRFLSVLSMTPEATKTHTHIDALYTSVLKSALNEEEMEKEEMEDMRVVLRTVLFAQEPISIETLATLARFDSTQRVASALQPLRSVVHLSEQTGLVSTLHVSFSDFMFNNDRSGAYFYDIMEHSQVLAERCFVVMKEQLRFNICALQSSFMPDEKVEDLEERIKQRISPTLAYACRYWGGHLVLASTNGSLLGMLEEFIRHRLLFWMEVSNLRRMMVMCVETLLKTKQWLNQMGLAPSELVGSVEDARNFVTGFAGRPVSHSTPHIYISSLPFCPRSSTVYKNYWPRTRGLLELKGSLMARRESAALATWNIGSDVNTVGCSPDGTRVAVGCSDGTVRTLNAHDGTPIVDPLQAHTGYVRSIAFSSDGKLLASGSDDKAIRVWNTYNGTLASGPSEGHTDVVYSVSFSPDGKRIISGSGDNTICIWNTTDCALLNGPLSGHDSAVLCVTFSPDSTLIASGSYDNTVRLWKSHDGTPAASPFKGHTDTIYSMSFTPNGSRLVSGSSDMTIRVWNISDGSLVTDPFEGHTDPIHSVAVSPDGTRVVSGSRDCTVRVWNIEDGTLVSGPFIGHTNWIWSVAFSPDGTRVISGSWDRTVRVWGVRDGLLSSPPPFRSHMNDIQSVMLAGNGTRIVSGSKDSSIWSWDITPEEVIPSHWPQTQTFFAPLMSPFEDYVPIFAQDYTIAVHNMKDGTLLAGPLHGHTDAVLSFTFSTDNTHLITGSRDCTICVWNLQKSALVGVPLRGHGDEVTYVAISSDHSRVVSCSKKDHTIRVWNTHSIMPPPPLSLRPRTGSSSDTEPTSAVEGWYIREDGWVTDSSSDFLIWIPADLASLHAWPSPHAEFIITKEGVLHIVQKALFVGEEWSQCYIDE